LAGNGGAGVVSSITGSPVQYAGGGGGGTYLGVGGLGGGGGAGNSNLAAGSGYSAIANTGSGGGAGNFGTGASGNNYFGGAGGSGIVVLRYPSYLKQAASTTGSPTYYQALGYNVYVFYASGTITF
jgi:hypothetical protein